MLRYCITDRHLGGIRSAAADYIQIRDKELSPRELIALTQRAIAAAPGAKVLVNDRADVALAAGAHGVHLRSHSIGLGEWRRVVPVGFLIGVSCHDLEELRQADGADFVVFGPVFDTPGKGSAVGIDGLREAVSVTTTPVLALGGVTWDNAPECMAAGAAGVAGIRLFQDPFPQGNE